MASIVPHETGAALRPPAGAFAVEHPSPMVGPLLARDRIADHTASLTTLIETEIVPRLVIAHALAPRMPADKPIIPAAEVEALAAAALTDEAEALLRRVDAVLVRDVTVDAVLVDLLAPTARLLGEWWESDRCDFIDVTMALWRLQEVVRDLAERFPPRPADGGGSPRALFAAMPGDQHGFGTVVIDEIFRRDGWTTCRLADPSTGDLLHRAANGWFDLVGLTVSCDCHIGDLPSLIVALRSVSRNPRLCVMVGGRVFGGDPALATRVGADGTAADATLALKLASGLVRTRRQEALACS